MTHADSTLSIFAADARPILFGEVTLEQYPNGDIAVGGSPFNIAWHLKGFGLDPLLIGKIGQDDEGGVILQMMRSWNMDISGLQHDSVLPTAVTTLSIVHGQPVYNTPPAQAYDAIGTESALRAVSKISSGALLHGTLALREFESQTTLDGVLSAKEMPVFLDANLREPWWNQVNLIHILNRASVLRLTEAELQILSGVFGYAANNLAESLQRLQEDFSLDVVVVSLGKSAAIMSTLAGEAYSAEVNLGVTEVDAVGVRDAFTAVVYFGLLKNWSPQDLMERALLFATLVSALPGATQKDRSVYESLLDDWR